MAGPSIARILGVASTSSKTELLRRTSFLSAFFTTWLKLDLTTLAAAVTIFGTISMLFRSLKSTSLKLYWWFTRFCTASISIASNDRLNKEILNWIGAQVLVRQGTRILTARTETIQTDAWLPRKTTERNDYVFEKRIPVQYLPTFGMTWFIHERHVFLVRRMPKHERHGASVPEEYASAPEGNEPLVVMCIGRSVVPIKRFLETCRDFAEKQRSQYVTVRVSKSQYHREAWDTTILRPMRPLETVHFDERVKAEIVADVENYLDPNTRKFYTSRGIPYRRGYLLHGTPGTGKTSLSLALAGYFGLELYLLHIPGVKEDSDLERLFTALPPRCMVLLEDIDAVGIRRRPTTTDEEDEEDEQEKVPKSRCTLSGLLNVLDGVASQEGRIVIMTSNYADRLDKALVRPGRIDKMIELGNVSQRSAELMFLRMYTPDESHPSTINFELKDGELEKLALSFASQIPENTFTPAQLQGLLLNRRNNPHAAVAETGTWVEEEKIKIEERKRQNKEAAQRRRERIKEKAAMAGLPMFAGGMSDVNDPEILDKMEAMLKAQKMKIAMMAEVKDKKVDENVEDTAELKPDDSNEGESEKELDATETKEKIQEGDEKIEDNTAPKSEVPKEGQSEMDAETGGSKETVAVEAPKEGGSGNGPGTTGSKETNRVESKPEMIGNGQSPEVTSNIAEVPKEEMTNGVSLQNKSVESREKVTGDIDLENTEKIQV